MSDERKPGSLIVSIARAISAAFLAILLTGPPPFGYLVLLSADWHFLDDLLAMLMMGVLRGLFAGIVAGRRLAVWAAILTSTWAFSGPLAGMVESLVHPHDKYWIYGLLATPIFLVCSSLYAALFGILGARLSERLRFERIGRRAWVWVTVGLLAVVGVGYTNIVGADSALRTLAPAVESSVVKGRKPEIKSEVRCVFPTVRVWPYGIGRGYSDLFYLDPTGKHILFTQHERAD